MQFQNTITNLRLVINSDANRVGLEQDMRQLKKLCIKSQIARGAVSCQQFHIGIRIGTFCELDVLYALGRQRLDDYELAAQRLNNMYFNTLKTLGQSNDYYELQSVYLLYLLSFNKIGQFYSEIELLPRQALDHPSIAFVISIEQALSIGNYAAVVPENPPTGLGSIFLKRIVETIRDQTAMSASSAYQRILLVDAMQIFHMNNIEELKRYALSNNYNWQFDDQYVHLEQRKSLEDPLNSDALIHNTLGYVHELDKII